MKYLLCLLFLFAGFGISATNARAQNIVTTPGWHPIPNTELKGTDNTSPCPPDNFWSPVFPVPPFFVGVCQNIMLAWGSAIMDPVRHRLIIWGGGHNDYGGNEVYVVDEKCIGEPTCAGSSLNYPIYRVTNPSSPNTMGAVDVETLSDGRPNSRHTWDGAVYAPNTDKYYWLGGSLNNNGGASNAVWSLDPTSVGSGCAPSCNSTWTKVATNSDLNSGTQVNSTDYNPNDGSIYMATEGNFGKFYPPTNTWTHLATTSMLIYGTGVIDPDENYYLYIGDNVGIGPGTGVSYFPLNAGGSQYVQTQPTLAASCPNFSLNSFGNSQWPGAFWDPIGHRVVVWPGAGNTLYYIYPKTWTCSSETYGSTVGVDYPYPVQSADPFTNKRFAYDSGLDMVVVCSDPAKNCFYLHMRRGDPVITNTTGGTLTNVPFTVAQPLRDGDIPNCVNAFTDYNGGAYAALSTTQTDVKNRWPDGSLKFAMISGIIPSILNNQSVHIVYDTQGTCNNTGFLTSTNMLSLSAPNWNFDAQIQLTGTASHFISARTILTAADGGSKCTAPSGGDIDGAIATSGHLCTYWLQGPIVTAVILEDRISRAYDVNTDAGTGNPLHPRFEAWFYPQGNLVQAGYTLENEWGSATATSSARSQTIATTTFTGGNSGPVTEYSQGTSFILTPFTFIRHTYCINGTGAGNANTCGPTVHWDHDWAYLAQTKFYPNWDPSLKMSASVMTSTASNYSGASLIFGGCTACYSGPNGGVGNYSNDINAGGLSPMHGPLTGWEIAYLTSQCDLAVSTAITCGNGSAGDVLTPTLGNSDFGGTFPMFYREADASAGHGQFFDAPTNTIGTKGRFVSVNARQQINLGDPTEQSSFCTAFTTAPLDWINVGAGGMSYGLWGSANWDTDSTSHWPNLAYVSYLTTGQYDYYEEQLQQGAYAIGFGPGCSGFTGSNTSYLRGGSTGYYYSGQERAVNWAERENALATFIAVDGSPEKNYLLDKLYQNEAWLEGQHDIPYDIPNVPASHVAAWNFGNASSALSMNPGRHDPTAGPSPLGSWEQLPAYVGNMPLCQVAGTPPGCLVAAQADANFQFGYSSLMQGWLYELGFATIAPLQFVVKRPIHVMLDPASNKYDLGEYVYPVQQTSGAWITNWTMGQSYNNPSQQHSSWAFVTGSSCYSPYESYPFEAAVSLSYGATYGLSNSGFSAATAYANVRAALQTCIDGSGGAGTLSFAQGTPMWDIVPRTFVAIPGNPQAAVPTFSPIAGSYSSSQSVIISTVSPSSIICYNTTGSPQTNGISGCQAGSSLYAGPVLVAISETLYAVAGGTGYTDSSVGSAVYTISTGQPVASAPALLVKSIKEKDDYEDQLEESLGRGDGYSGRNSLFPNPVTPSLRSGTYRY
jgi:hypothetical protein